MARQRNSMFVGRQEILGRTLDDRLDPVKTRSEFVGRALDDRLDPVKTRSEFVGLALDDHLDPVKTRSEFVGKDEILGALDDRLDPVKTRAEFILGDDALTEIVTSGAFVGAEEKELAREGGASELAALRRRTAASCGYNSHWAYVHGEATSDDLAKIKKLAKGGNKKAKKILARIEKIARSCASGEDSSPLEKQEARKILDSAAATKSISRDSLKRAIWLYAGKQSTEKERAAIGSKMIAFLNKHQVKLS